MNNRRHGVPAGAIRRAAGLLPALLIGSILLLLPGCGRSSTSEGTVARVSSSSLTMDDARRAIDTAAGPVNRQLPRYIAGWVTDELLYQEAQKQGIENSDLFKKRMDETRRQLAIQALLQQTVYSDTGGLDEPTIRTYFAEHASEFFVQEDMMKLNVIGFNAREPASDFAAGLGQDNSWPKAIQRARSSNAGAIIAQPANQFFSQRTLFPPELWKVATTLNLNEVSFPIKTNLGYFVIQLLGVIPKGKPAEIDVVRDEVRSRMQIERRRQKYAEFLGTLRKRYDVEVLFNAAAAEDSTRMQSHE